VAPKIQTLVDEIGASFLRFHKGRIQLAGGKPNHAGTTTFALTRKARRLRDADRAHVIVASRIRPGRGRDPDHETAAVGEAQIARNPASR
jgi:hypothetical protein